MSCLPRLALTVAILSALASTADTRELPRSTSTTPVRALVDCFAESCDIAEHCARVSDWEGITESDFSRDWQLSRRQLIFTPMRSNGSLLCYVAVREGAALISAYRYFRTKNANDAWTTVGAERDYWFFLEKTEPDHAPADALAFFRRVKGRQMCFDGCGPNDDYIYFEGSEWGTGVLGRSFTAFTTEGNLRGNNWDYEYGGENRGTVKLLIDDPGYETCWINMTFETATSGTHSTRCDESEGGDGPWAIRDR